jgi:hypothetical protein
MPGLEAHVSSTYVVELAESLGGVAPLAMALAGLGVSTRRWWGSGLQGEEAFADCASSPLLITARLGRQTIGLPCSLDLTAQEVARVCAAIASVLRAQAPPQLDTPRPVAPSLVESAEFA